MSGTETGTGTPMPAATTAAGAPAPRFAPLPAGQSADAMERALLERWREERLFARSLEAREGAEPFVFFEGPPTANGKPGIHHVFSRTIKDLFCRHRAMRGRYVPRKAGWDTHGLPVEIEVEKQLGISGKPDIERVGVAEFNRLCRESVFRYRGDWERLSERIAYWLDYDDPYVTYTHDYVESVWWALATLHRRGLLYRGHKILPYCARCGTALSSHEVAQGYKDVPDPSVYVALDLVSGGPPDAALGPEADAPGARRILVWTTTPWTLVSNVALAVHPELTYVEVRRKSGDRRTLILAEARLAGVFGGDWADRWDVAATYGGAELIGARYRRPIDWLPYPEGAHEVVVGEEFVSATDGSGIVHMAPAFGGDDYAAGQRHGLAFLQPVNGRGEFPADLPLVGGLFVKAADPILVEHLRATGPLWKATTEVHSYPHCWRCGTPLLQYARTSWFVRTTAFKDEMLARNAGVNWNPAEVGQGRFGEWLVNNIDWAISRDRYWGTPLPVWVNDADPDEIEVVGSYAELAGKVGRALPADFDPHKPHVDEYTWPAPSGTGTMRRVPEVIDTWFDSGSMPFAQWHYPFENRELVARRYPADFIAEGVDQTRGWFYSLLAIATGLGDALPNNADAAGGGSGAEATVVAPYRSVVVNDLVLDAAGQKMSKSRGNAVDPWAVVERHGVDAVRLFLVASSQVWVPRRFDEEVIRETAGRFLVTLRNVYGFFALYANFGWAPSPDDPPVEARAPIDRWVLSRLATVSGEVDRALEAYDATGAARTLMAFVTDDVSNWYVRLTRARYWAADGAVDRAAFATLHAVLVGTCRLLAPFAPFVSDRVHRELTGGASVHVADYPDGADAGARDEALEAAMADVRELARLGRAARQEAGINVRQPLGRAVCVAPPATAALVTELFPLLAAELNVKRVELATSADALVTLEAKANFRTLGKKAGKQTPQVAQAVAALPAASLHALEGGEEVAVSVGADTFRIALEDVTILRRASGDLLVQEAGGRFAALDPAITPALRQEGTAREFVSRVQRLRKELDLDVSDRVRVAVDGDADVRNAIAAHREWVAGEILARELSLEGFDGADADTGAHVASLEGFAVRVAITRA